MGMFHIGPKKMIDELVGEIDSSLPFTMIQLGVQSDITLPLKNRISDLEYQLSLAPKEIIKYVEVPLETVITKEIERLVPFETIKEIEKRVEVVVEKQVEVVKEVEVVVEKFITKEIEVIKKITTIPKFMFGIVGIQLLVIIILLIK